MRIFAIALFLIMLILEKGGNARAAAPQCGGTGVNYSCMQLIGQAAGAPDSVTDIGPLPHYATNGSIDYYFNSGENAVEQCQVVWNSPHYIWTAWAMAGSLGGTNCNQFWNSYLGVWSSWGYNQSPHSYNAPAGF